MIEAELQSYLKTKVQKLIKHKNNSWPSLRYYSQPLFPLINELRMSASSETSSTKLGVELLFSHLQLVTFTVLILIVSSG